MNRATIITAMLLAPIVAAAEMHALVVEGLAGDAGYAERFERQSGSIAEALQSQADRSNVLVLRGDDATRDAVLERLGGLQGDIGASDQFVLVLLGHGSYDDYDVRGTRDEEHWEACLGFARSRIDGSIPQWHRRLRQLR